MLCIAAHLHDLALVNRDHDAAGRGTDSAERKMISHWDGSTLVENRWVSAQFKSRHCFPEPDETISVALATALDPPFRNC
jgi:hypothetical protein